MAASDLSGFNGAVAMPTGHGGEARGFSVRRTMNNKATNRYGADRFGRFRGGILTIGGDINLYMRKGAAATAPGIVSPSADGATLLLTLETGCTLSGIAIFPDYNLNHAFEDPAIESTMSYLYNGTVTETWAVA
jgi:hypothetical protein